MTETIRREDFTANYFILLKETFEGPIPGEPSAFLDQGGGLFQTLATMTAEEASRSVRPGGATIAGHCEHLRFYIDLMYDFIHGAQQKIDWSQSWLVSAVDAANEKHYESVSASRTTGCASTCRRPRAGEIHRQGKRSQSSCTRRIILERYGR